MVVILGRNGSVDNSAGLIPATISSLNPTLCLVDGSSTAIQVLTGHPYTPQIGDRVGLQQIGRQYLALPIDAGLGVASYPGTAMQMATISGSSGMANYSDIVNDPSYEWAWLHYYMDEANIVHIGGLAQLGGANVNPGTLIFTLPPAYRPNKILRFCAGNANGIAEVEIYPDGSVKTAGVTGSPLTGSALAASTYYSLDMVHFPSDTCPNPPNWTDLTSLLTNGWTNFGNSYANVRGWVSPVGDLFIQGTFNNANTALTGNFLSAIPASLAATGQPTAQMFIAAGNGIGTYVRIDVGTANDMNVSTYMAGATGAAISLDGLVIASSLDITKWHNIPAYANSWATFPGWGAFQLYRNPIGRVYARGLIQSGTTGVTFGPAFNNNSWIRPTRQHLQVGIASGGGARLDTQPGGTAAGSVMVVNYWNAATNGFVSVNHMQWDTITR